MIGCVGTVLTAQRAPKEDKPRLMNLHKSLGLLTGMIVAPRVAYRIFNRAAVRLLAVGTLCLAPGLFYSFVSDALVGITVQY
jgi:cytochrome b561